MDFHQAPVKNQHDQPQEAAQRTADTLTEIHGHLRLEMQRAQERHQEQADRYRLPAPHFRIGDRVWLDSRNIRTTRPSRKLDYRRLGPYPIEAIISPYAYRLALPRDIRIHPVQPVSLLEPAHDNPYPGQRIPPPPPVVVEGEQEWQVDEVLDSRIRRRRLEYLVKWTGYDEPDWRPARDVNGLAAIDVFHRQYPDKPGPLPE